MDVFLIPGLWLDGSSWSRVVPVIAQAGHRAHPLTLPGMESKDVDRSGITLRDHVDAVATAVDAIDPAGGQVAVVGHSAACGLAYAAADARPERVARVVYVGGFPTGDGQPVVSGFTVENGQIAFPDWSELDDADLVGLDDAALAEFRERAIPSPGCLASEPQRLGDRRRYDVPVTVICPEFTSTMLREWIDAGEAPVAELAAIRDVEYIDLPTGHWPQFSRPQDLGRAIVDAIGPRDGEPA